MIYDADAQRQIFKDAMGNLCKFLDRNPEFERVVCCDNDKFLKFMITIHATNKSKEYKMKVKDDKNVILKFIYDKKDGIFKTKKKNRILAPHMITLIQDQIIHNEGLDKNISEKLEQQYYKKYGCWNNNNDTFSNEIQEDRIKNHTGNHYRNKKINVPKSVYGNK